MVYAQEHTNHAKQKHHKHHLSVVNGGVRNFSHVTNTLTTGMDYEYRFSNLVGAGILTEVVFLHSNEFEIGLPIFFHPIKGLKFIADPLIAFTKEPTKGFNNEHNSTEGAKRTESSFHFRVGAGYDFQIHNLSFGPEINMDFSETQALVGCLSIGYGF